MLKSMTGYGSVNLQQGNRTYILEVKSVNHRYCDVNVKVPSQYGFLENEIKKFIKERFSRGRFDVYLDIDELEGNSRKISFDHALAARYLKELKELGTELGIETPIDLFSLIKLPEVIKIEKEPEDQEEIIQSVQKTLELALAQLEEMRKKEGELLRQEILTILNRIQAATLRISQRAPLIPVEYKKNLQERVRNLLENTLEVDEARLLQEVVIFAERMDITEELARLNSHLTQFYKLTESEEPVGKRLDFLIQEMNREVNTIGSKANDALVSQEVVEIKTEMERMREQVQNIE
ncbi:MAG TPA: YicC/YloC family endoribonuclease [Candidatus Limnocylindrales bacterium]|nr:YicC/YloC family endoribonuclease [Candidatus Limnocylindrales bacterium]